MITSRLIQFFVAILLVAAPASSHARDWFVRAGGTGDGSREKPFGDPFEALATCEANDVIHIAEGRYTGKLDSGEWTVPFDGIQLVGGYTADFSARDPWTHRTMLVWDHNAKNRPKDARITANVRNVVLDGLVIDGQEQNKYDPDPVGRTPSSLDIGTNAVRLSLPGVVRNCVFLNTGREAVNCANGTTIENNLFLNTFDCAVKINGLPSAAPESKVPSIVKGNTFLWSWCDRAPGTGRYSGAGIQMSGPANISNNIFAHCDNNAIYCTINPERSSITNNVFFMNLWSNFKMFIEGTDVLVDDDSMDLFEETGLKAFDGNEVLNPELPFDLAWLDGAAKRTAGEPGKLEMDDWNKMRQTLGMDLVGTGGTAATGIAPPYALEKAIALMTPKNASMKAGARIVKLEAKFSAPTVVVEKSYEKGDLLAWAKSPDSVDGKAMEMVVAISGTANVTGIPEAYKTNEHEGVFLHDEMGKERITGFFKKGSAVNRAVTEGAYKYDGNGKAKQLYVVKGIAYVIKSFPKAGFYIESITPVEAGATAARVRPKGRDWFVRAGASGGNGSKEKPFRDPYQALEKVEAGDTIHVAGGEYVGKLKTGMWKVDCPDIAMLGGYDKDFTTRDPWKNMTLLYCPADFKGSRGGYTFQGDGDHTGFILDGFVFDKILNNQYDHEGNLQMMESDKTEHLWLARPGCEVRNCIFLNGAMGAVRMTASQTIQNCIFFNHNVMAVRIEGGFTPEVPLVFRNNTLAFAWEKRFGKGMGITADLLIIEGGIHAIVDNNIFEFADNHAIRLNAEPKDVELTNNVFAHNLFAEVYRAKDGLVVDNKNFGDLRQLGFKKLENNVLTTPGLPIDQKWFDVYLNRTAYVPGKVQMDDWNKLREVLGQPMIATGGEPGTGLAPAYDRKLAMGLFPKNPDIKAGARPVKLEVKFEGITREVVEHEYAETTWEVAKNADEWAKLDGQRVMLKVAIKSGDNQWLLNDITKDKYSAWQVGGPEGIDSGLPMRVYTPLGTQIERAFEQSKGYSTGKPEEFHLIKGIARAKRQMVIEAVEKAD